MNNPERMVRKDTGYAFLRVHGHPRADTHGYVFEHIIVAERAMGKYLTEPHQVHHVNFVRHDNSNTNLVICEDQSYHGILHARTRILKAGGDPDLHKFCTICKRLKFKTDFTTDSNKWDRKASTCNQCQTRKRAEVRRQRGARIRRATLTIEELTGICNAYDAGVLVKDICRLFKIVPSNVRWARLRMGRYKKLPPKTHCKYGHELARNCRGKYCRVCHREREKDRRQSARIA